MAALGTTAWSCPTFRDALQAEYKAQRQPMPEPLSGQLQEIQELVPLLGWTLVAGVVAIAGLPPFGIFTSEFLVVSSTFARQSLLAVPLALGLLVAFGALLLNLQGIIFGEPSPGVGKAKASYLPIFGHLALVFVAGFFFPPLITQWFQHVARLLG